MGYRGNKTGYFNFKMNRLINQVNEPHIYHVVWRYYGITRQHWKV